MRLVLLLGSCSWAFGMLGFQLVIRLSRTTITLKEMHRQFLDDDSFTDVMTFNLSEIPPIESEIYISIDRARDNANQYEVSYLNEIMRLIIHACLHLAGHEDYDETKRAKMKAKEDHYHALALNRIKV